VRTSDVQKGDDSIVRYVEALRAPAAAHPAANEVLQKILDALREAG